MRCILQAVRPATPSAGGAGKGEEATSFLARFGTHLEHQTGFGNQDPSTKDGRKRHAQELLGACRIALEAPPAPADDQTLEALDFVCFSDVYLSLVRARLAQQARDANASAGVERTRRLQDAVLRRQAYLNVLDRVDQAWTDYSARLDKMVKALQQAQTPAPA
ncbi:hypothetical protein D9M69_617030 [compost metagenome]